ncbi:MAG: hypothetical protein ACMXYE_03795 [Candidatus Woesearchaeota archaeon]
MDFQHLKTFFTENKDWAIIPASVSIAIIILGMLLMYMNGRGVSFFIKALFTILVIASPVLGFLLGPYVKEYLNPYMDKIFKK